MKRITTGLLALLLLLTLCVGCGNTNDANDTSGQTGGDTQSENTTANTKSLLSEVTGIDSAETMMELEGTAIPADIYLYWLVNTCNELEYQLNIFSMYYGMYSETLDEEGKVLWDQSIDGTPLDQMAREQAESSALSYALIENIAKANGVSLTSEDQTAIDEAIDQQITDSGSEETFLHDLYEQGLSLDSYKRMVSDSYLYQHLTEIAADPASALYTAPGDDNAYVDHILLMTIDSETNEPLSEEEIQAKREQAEDLLSQLQASDDLQTLFTEFADTYGEDPGRTADAGYLIDPDTSFVQEFKDAAFALKPGEISEIVESNYGYHIILRKDLTEDQLASLAENTLQDYLNEQMETAMTTVVRNEKLDSIDVGSIYNSYVEKLQELHPETAADTEDSSSDSGDADGEVTPDSADDTAA